MFIMLSLPAIASDYPKVDDLVKRLNDAFDIKTNKKNYANTFFSDNRTKQTFENSGCDITINVHKILTSQQTSQVNHLNHLNLKPGDEFLSNIDTIYLRDLDLTITWDKLCDPDLHPNGLRLYTHRIPPVGPGSKFYNLVRWESTADNRVGNDSSIVLYPVTKDFCKKIIQVFIDASGSCPEIKDEIKF